jgi:phage gp29-like protein
MFKAYTQRDWAIFTQTYGQPLRVGKYRARGRPRGTSDTLFTAVANIAGDCAAIIPEIDDDRVRRNIECRCLLDALPRAGRLARPADQQGVLGQTATTDAVTGGLGSGKEHREVQEDIERADARALAAILNRDLIRPWVELNYGPQARYPRLIIARPEAEDLTRLATALAALVPLGLRVSQSEIRDKFGLADPATDDDVLRLAPVVPPVAAPVGDPANPNPIIKRVSGEIKRVGPVPGPQTALNAEGPSAVKSEALSETDLLTDRLAREARPAVAGMLGQIEAMLGAAGSLEELREMLMAGFPDVDATALSDLLAQAMLAAHTGGRAMLEEESRG